MQNQFSYTAQQLEIPPSAGQHLAYIVQGLMTEIDSKKGANHARQWLFSQVCNNTFQNQEFLKLVKSTGQVMGLYIDRYGRAPQQALNEAIAIVTKIKCAFFYVNNNAYMQGLDAVTLADIQQSIQLSQELDNNINQYLMMLSGQVPQNWNTTPTTGMSVHSFNQSNGGYSTGNGFSMGPTATMGASTGGGMAMSASAFTPSATTSSSSMFGDSSPLPTTAVGPTKSEVVVVNGIRVRKHVPIEEFGAAPNSSANVSLVNQAAQVASSLLQSNTVSGFGAAVEIPQIVSSEKSTKIYRTVTEKRQYAVVYNPRIFTAKLVLNAENQGVEQFYEVAGAEYNDTGDFTSIMDYEDYETDETNRAALRDGGYLNEKGDPVATWSGVLRIKRADVELPVNQADLSDSVNPKDFTVRCDANLGVINAVSIQDAKLKALGIVDDMETSPECFEYIYRDPMRIAIKNENTYQALCQVIESVSFDGFYESFGLLKDTIEPRFYDRLNRKLTELTLFAIRTQMGIPITITDFDTDYPDLLKEIRKSYGVFMLEMFRDNIIEVAMGFKGAAEFIGDTEGSHPTAICFNWQTRVYHLPFSEKDMSLMCNEESGLLLPTYSPMAYRSMDVLLTEWANETKCKNVGLSLVTNDDHQISICRGYIDPSAILVRFDDRIEK
jgi:hypothetical protein